MRSWLEGRSFASSLIPNWFAKSFEMTDSNDTIVELGRSGRSLKSSTEETSSKGFRATIKIKGGKRMAIFAAIRPRCSTIGEVRASSATSEGTFVESWYKTNSRSRRRTRKLARLIACPFDFSYNKSFAWEIIEFPRPERLAATDRLPRCR